MKVIKIEKYYNAGVVNILQAKKLLQFPKLYSAIMVYILTYIYDNLPENGDSSKPLAALFFDEAHLMFNKENKHLISQVERVIRLIRSKGVGIYFVSQSPSDIPDNILGQTGLRIQHRLSAYTPKQQKSVKSAAETMPQNETLGSLAKYITKLSIGQALVSTLDEKGTPKPAELCYIAPPNSFIGEVSKDTLEQLTPKEKHKTERKSIDYTNNNETVSCEKTTILIRLNNYLHDLLLDFFTSVGKWCKSHWIISLAVLLYVIGVIKP